MTSPPASLGTQVQASDLETRHYPARALRNCQYTVDQRTGVATTFNTNIAEEIPNSHASVIITRNRKDGTTRITGAWLERIQGDDHWEVKQEDATSYASKTGEPSFGLFESAPHGIRAVVACGVTKDDLEMYNTKVFLQSGTIPNLSLRQAEATVITNYRPPESRDEGEELEELPADVFDG